MVICEGAGSPAEINLLDHDLVNLGLADAAGIPALVVGDIASAADVFAPVHESTGGADGFVSIEVSPLLAADTAGTDVASTLGRTGSISIMARWPSTAT